VLSIKVASKVHVVAAAAPALIKLVQEGTQVRCLGALQRWQQQHLYA
jgi:hypothetical protein